MRYIDPDVLVRDFCTLARIEGTSLKEKQVADYIKNYLEPLDFKINEQILPDAMGESGNLLCIPDETDPRQPLILLAAHMDTVRSTEKLNPVIKDGVITSDGTTILGADNRAGVAALLHMLRSAREHNIRLNNLGVLFTVGEEIGMVGARHLDLSMYPTIERIFVFDCSKRPGVFIQHCYGCMKFQITVHGKPAHAGVAPEKGVNAIAIAAEIINEIEQGRHADDATINIGTIRGGDTTNVVSSEVHFDGEIRGPSMKLIEHHLKKVQESAGRIATQKNGTLDSKTQLAFAPFVIDPATQHYKAAEKIIIQAGLKPEPIRYTGGSDANAFNAAGIPAINFGIGAQQPHSNEEFIYIEDLVKTTELIFYAATKDVVTGK